MLVGTQTLFHIQAKIHSLSPKAEKMSLSVLWLRKLVCFCLNCERAINVFDCAKNALISFLTALALALSAEKIIAQTKLESFFL